MEEKKHSFWQVLRKMLGSQRQLPFADTEAAMGQLPETSWQHVAYDERTAERPEIDKPR